MSDTEEPTLAVTRSRRSNAGSRMKELIEQQVQAGIISVGVEEIEVSKPERADSVESTSQVDSIDTPQKRIDDDFNIVAGMSFGG